MHTGRFNGCTATWRWTDDSLKETEARVAWALKQVAEGVEVSDADQRRVEDTYRELLASGRQGLWRGRRRALALTGVAACLVLGVALAAVVLLGRPAQRPAPAVPTPSALTAADLVGVWRFDVWSDVPVWEFRADGRLATWNGPEDLLDRLSQQPGSFAVEGDLLTVTPSPGCELRMRVSPPFGARIAVTKLSISSPCAGRFFDNWWVNASLTRILPTPDPRIQPGYQVGSQLQPVTWMTRRQRDVAGLGHITNHRHLGGSLCRGEPVVRRGLSGVRSVDERGTVQVVGHGEITLQPEGARCKRRFVNVTSDYARLSLHLSGASCGGSGAPEESWLRLN